MQRRGGSKSAISRLPILHDLINVDFLTISSLWASEKAGRKWVNSAIFPTQRDQGRPGSHWPSPLTPGDKGLKEGEEQAVSPLTKAALPWQGAPLGSFKCLPARLWLSGLYYFSQEEATWKWHLPHNLDTSWKTIITHHIIITCHGSLPPGTLASVSSILKFLPCPEKQDKAL